MESKKDFKVKTKGFHKQDDFFLCTKAFYCVCVVFVFLGFFSGREPAYYSDISKDITLKPSSL